MRHSNPLAERERALENAFFQKETERLLEKMRKKDSRDAQMKSLANVLGVDKAGILEPLLDLGLRESNISALVIAPLVSIAWADGQMDNEERRLITKFEIALGVDPDSEAGELVDLWLHHRPHESLIDIWARYVGELCEVLSDETCKKLRDDIVSRASRIARAFEKSFLRGGGPTAEEKAVIRKIEDAFSGVPGSANRSQESPRTADLEAGELSAQ